MGGAIPPLPQYAFMAWCLFKEQGQLYFYLYHRVQTGSESHPASYPMGTRGYSPGVKRPGHEASHSLPSNAEIKNACSIPPLPYTSSRRCA
jgi:hypothetical protein